MKEEILAALQAAAYKMTVFGEQRRRYERYDRESLEALIEFLGTEDLTHLQLDAAQRAVIAATCEFWEEAILSERRGYRTPQYIGLRTMNDIYTEDIAVITAGVTVLKGSFPDEAIVCGLTKKQEVPFLYFLMFENKPTQEYMNAISKNKVNITVAGNGNRLSIEHPECSRQFHHLGVSEGKKKHIYGHNFRTATATSKEHLPSRAFLLQH